MILHASLYLLCFLWLLVCWRFYSMISKENTGQRRVIAIAAGLGAGLLYMLGSMLLPVLQAWTAEPPVKEVEGFRIQSR